MRGPSEISERPRDLLVYYFARAQAGPRSFSASCGTNIKQAITYNLLIYSSYIAVLVKSGHQLRNTQPILNICSKKLCMSQFIWWKND